MENLDNKELLKKYITYYQNGIECGQKPRKSEEDAVKQIIVDYKLYQGDTEDLIVKMSNRINVAFKAEIKRFEATDVKLAVSIKKLVIVSDILVCMASCAFISFYVFLLIMGLMDGLNMFLLYVCFSLGFAGAMYYPNPNKWLAGFFVGLMIMLLGLGLAGV